MTNFWPGSGKESIDIKKESNPLTAQGRFQDQDSANIGSCVFYGCTIRTDGTNSVTFSLWDATTVSGGNRIGNSDVVVNGSDRLVSLNYDPPLPCLNGVFMEVNTSGTFEAIVQYDN